MYYVQTSILLWMLCALKPSLGSYVVDGGQKAINVSHYCPKMEYCAEGSHVICMYYNPKQIMGPLCVQPLNISITPEIAKTIIDVINVIRTRLTLGKETGKDNKPLPRAYGMHKLQWDSELATFAQVFGNQCLMKFDRCRATKRFPDPGQAIARTRLGYLSWVEVGETKPFLLEPGLTKAKIHHYIVDDILTWYKQKTKVTPEMIRSNTDTRNTYLKMVVQGATHVGCGLSAFAEYIFSSSTDLVHNSLQLTCNYSARPKKGEPVYTVRAPTEEGYTKRCGCPEGYDEDVDCLCYETPTANSSSPCDRLNGCKPSVVLLPIFTVEDAPKELLTGEAVNYRNLNMTASLRDTPDTSFPIKQLEIGDYQDLEIPSKLVPVQTNDPPIVRPTKNKERISYRISYKPEPKPITTRARTVVRKRYFNKNSMNPENWHRRVTMQDEASHHLPQRKSVARSSIFSRAPKFELPSGRRSNLNPYKIKINSFKRNMDVAPRKDFSYSQKLLDKYLSKKRSRDDTLSININPQVQKETDVLLPQYKDTITQTMDKSGLNQYLKNKFHYSDFNITDANKYDIKSSADDSDKKLMTLLDNLEQEVKHIELDVTGKEIFDAKIRKIYGTVVRKSPDLLRPTIDKTTRMEHNDLRRDDFNKYYSNGNNRVIGDNIEDPAATTEKRIFQTEDKIKELHSKFPDKYLETKVAKLRSSARNQNSPISLDGNDITNHLDNLNKMSSVENEMKNLSYLRSTLNNIDETSRIISLNDNINKPFEDDFRGTLITKSNANGLRNSRHSFDNSDLKSRNNIDKLYGETSKNPSFENVRFSDIESSYKKRKLDNYHKFKTRNHYRNEMSRPKTYEDLMKSKTYYEDRGNSRFDDEIRNRNYKDYDKDNNDDPLGLERRKYYQEKLENLERRLQSTRASRHFDHESERARRLMRPTARREDVQIRPSRTKNQLNFYLPDRSRILHGF